MIERLGILGALGSCGAFIGTATIIPFMPDGRAASARGFPAMAGNVPFLMKDIVLKSCCEAGDQKRALGFFPCLK